MPAREVAIKARHAVWALAMPFLLLFGLRIGWFTPTQLGAIAAAYALFVGLFVYQGFSFRETYELARESAYTTANVMLIIAASAIFSVVLTLEEVPQTVVGYLLAMTDNKYVALALINVLLLLLGTVMEGLSLMVILSAVPSGHAEVRDRSHSFRCCSDHQSHHWFRIATDRFRPVHRLLDHEMLDRRIHERIHSAAGGPDRCFFLITFLPETVLFLPRILF